MIGDMISKIRKEKGVTKTQIANETNINIGHLTHIEKGERNPSHKALKEICTALKIPYQQLYNTYDKELNDEQVEYNYINYLSYNKIPAVSQIDEYITCPPDFSNASFAYKIPDNSMEPMFKEGKYAFIEVNGVIENKAIGLFKLNDKYLIRRLMYKNGRFVLRADNKSVKDILVHNKDSFKIIGKVYI
ncbi:MAG: XRE family transcriptional regulator [Clostridia bacterium]|nr:XRE family transcriptional regulator [Clostridia bacterium]